MTSIRSVSASLLDGLAWLMEWPSRGARGLAGWIRPTDGGPRPTVPK